MGRALRHKAPAGVATARCSKCETELPADQFYWKAGGRRAHNWCKACTASYDGRRYTPTYRGELTCQECGVGFMPRREGGSAVYCSRACRIKVDDRRALAKYHEENPKPRLSCPHCGVEFQARRLNQRFCSEACMQAAHNATRKAKWKTGAPTDYVSRAYIIERDGGRCHLCGKTCEPSEIHLDHVVPLALGGSHDAANLRVACAACNLSKGARAVGEQLSLVG